MAVDYSQFGTWNPQQTMTFDHRWSSMQTNTNKLPATLWGMQGGYYVYVSKESNPNFASTKVLWLVDPNTGQVVGPGRNFKTDGRGINDVFGNDAGSEAIAFTGQPTYGARMYSEGVTPGSAKSVADGSPEKKPVGQHDGYQVYKEGSEYVYYKNNERVSLGTNFNPAGGSTTTTTSTSTTTSANTQAPSGGGTPPTGGTQPPTGGGTQPTGGTQPPTGGGSNPSTDAEFQTWLKSQNLTPDQAAAITAIYNTVVSQDAARAEQLVAGMKAATEFSDPYFKAQIRLATDALDRGMQKIEGDLPYNENRLSTLLADLKRDIANAGDYLDFQKIKQMKDLERRLGRDLDTTRQDMAARGFGSSSIRAKEETYINDVYGDMRESTNRAFLEQRTKLSDTLSRGERDNAAEVARLRQLAEQGKLDLVRAAESELGTKNLPGTYGDYSLGDVTGNIERARAQDALSFANSFVF